jgi:hypothetical protein
VVLDVLDVLAGEEIATFREHITGLTAISTRLTLAVSECRHVTCKRDTLRCPKLSC